MRANDALSGLVLILLSLAMIALTLSFPAFPGQKYGPALFPRILGTGLIVCGAILIWNGINSRKAGSGSRAGCDAGFTGRASGEGPIAGGARCNSLVQRGIRIIRAVPRSPMRGSASVLPANSARTV